MPAQSTPVDGIAAGVPFLAVPPITAPSPDTPVVIAWHLMDPPRTERAFASALPLDGLDAWRIYLGLPLCGARLPAGGMDELMRRGYEDGVLNLHGPIVTQGAEELPAAWAELQRRFELGGRPLGLVGGSMGSAIAQLVATETAPAAGIPVAAAVLISPVARLRPVVDALRRRFGVTYTWSAESAALARRRDFAERAGDFAANGAPAVQLIVGADDDADGFLHPAQALRDALAAHYDDPARADLVVIPGMAHALAEEPGDEPAPQTAHAAAVDRHAVAWLRQHLPAAEA